MDTANLIKRHEGFVPKVYRDTAGVLTVGWGHALTEGSAFPKTACEALFDADMARAQSQYEILARELGVALDPVRQAVLVNMLFNLGPGGVRKFKSMLDRIKQAQFTGAALEMLDSAWARQTGARARELAEMMRTGTWPHQEAS